MLKLALPIVLFCLFLCCAMPAVQAQNDDTEGGAIPMSAFTEAEKVGFAFYQLARIKAPIDEWIYASEKYLEAHPKVRLYMMPEERKRLAAGLQAYDPRRDLITIRTKVRLHGMDNPAYASDPVARHLKHTKALEIYFGSPDEEVFFPYQVGKLWIAIHPGFLKQKTLFGMDEDAYSRIARSLGSHVLNGLEDVDVEIVVMPFRANGKTPMVVNDMPIWVVASDIGSIRLLDQDERTLWDMTADWYTAAEEKRAPALAINPIVQ